MTLVLSEFDREQVSRLAEDPPDEGSSGQVLELQRRVVTKLMPRSRRPIFDLTVWAGEGDKAQDITFHGLEASELRALGLHLIAMSRRPLPPESDLTWETVDGMAATLWKELGRMPLFGALDDGPAPPLEKAPADVRDHIRSIARKCLACTVTGPHHPQTCTYETHVVSLENPDKDVTVTYCRNHGFECPNYREGA